MKCSCTYASGNAHTTPAGARPPHEVRLEPALLPSEALVKLPLLLTAARALAHPGINPARQSGATGCLQSG